MDIKKGPSAECREVYVVPALLLFTISCESTTDASINVQTETVSIHNSEVFEYQTGILGDKEGATIIQQAEHHHISKIVRDSTTEWEAIYTYKSEEDFEGGIVLRSSSKQDQTVQASILVLPLLLLNLPLSK